MVDLQPYDTSETYEDGKAWLVQVDRKFNETVTLDLAAFTAPAILSADSKFILSGVPLKDNGSGLKIPALGASDTIIGHLFGTERKGTGTRAVAAMMTHGVVDRSEVPGPVGGTAVLPALIRYV
jgi:hypothetical protein